MSMKPILTTILALTLAGCTKTYQEVSELEAKCRELGGTPVYTYWTKQPGTVSRVNCSINGNLYPEGDYK